MNIEDTGQLPDEEGFRKSFDKAQEWARSVGMTQKDVDDAIKDVRREKRQHKSEEGWDALRTLNKQAEENGLTGMSLDEINAEIKAARADKHKGSR